MRAECLNVSWFWNFLGCTAEDRSLAEEYNREQPHSAPDYRTRENFARQWFASAVSRRRSAKTKWAEESRLPEPPKLEVRSTTPCGAPEAAYRRIDAQISQIHFSDMACLRY